MGKCECLSGCPFFNNVMADMPSTSDRLKKKYCLEDNSTCARYIVFKGLGKDRVPTTLFPMQKDRADELIAAG